MIHLQKVPCGICFPPWAKESDLQNYVGIEFNRNQQFLGLQITAPDILSLYLITT